MRSYLAAAITGASLLVVPALAEDKMPNAQYQETLVKTYLLTLNDADLTDNFAVLHDKLAKPFREQFTPEQLRNSFKALVDGKMDWGFIVALPPVINQAAIDEHGTLLLHGYFDTKPSRLNYELDFAMSEGQWKPVKVSVNVKKPEEDAKK